MPALALAQLSFEQYEGYTTGVFSAGALIIRDGSAEITNLKSLDGAQSAWLLAESNGLSAQWPYLPVAVTGNSAVSYLSWAIETPLSENEQFYDFSADGAYIRLAQESGVLSMSVYDPTVVSTDSEQPGQAYVVYSVELTSGQNWSRLTIRFDHQNGYCDFYVNGQIVAADFPLVQGVTALSIETTPGSELYLDRMASLDQPLDFADIDRDGLPDDWETANSLAVGIVDRYSDKDGDGESNLLELMNGTDPAEGIGGATANSEPLGGLTIFIAGRGFFTVNEQADRSPLVRK
ncbi:hypothetical protein [Cerasicoccus arenae]|uniref:Uncharacterized protein n=1 Tax=Cerasicoccus arenae TaxID=424488 RepID=A0A8J3GFH8_9BACT|nr:hypothetical protein [Cerasicoccus arenae]MBK1857753.1 hypothetical protein [Cerasicoccus arenae]GHC11870.1 hypothetical protein GCM10007047_31480 [Cerasicoccus arenae]